VLVKLQMLNPARAVAKQAAELKPDDALTLDTIGCVFSHTGDHPAAIELFARAVELEPENTEYLFNLASSQRFLGNFAAAEQSHEKAIATDPGFYKAHWSLSNLRRQSAEANHIDRLLATLRDSAGDRNASAFLHNALAKEYDDIGANDQAFQHLTAGKSLIRETLDYSIQEDQALVDHIIGLFSTPMDQARSCDSAEPIFIVGMPRTGTTLAERIVSSHSQVYGAGELRNFALMMKRMSGTRSHRILDNETLDRALQLDPQQLGETYIESTRPATGHTPHFTDKTPLNFLNIGYIARALPNARIVCLRRNPLDTCLSNFRQMFSPDSSPYYRYSYDLLETGRYYLLFDQLMQHWEQVLPGSFLRVDYEALVADQETQSRRLLAHCGLDWEPACLEFERNEAPVATASATQVRQKIYSDATARWKRYANQLQPLRELLETSGIIIPD